MMQELDLDGSGQSERSVYMDLPETVPIHFTLQAFPATPALKDSCGLPWSAAVSPFMNSDVVCCSNEAIPISLIARCKHCFAYINPFCDLRGRFWKCSLCYEVQPFSKAQARYKSHDAEERLPELTEQVLEYEIPLEMKVLEGNSELREEDDEYGVQVPAEMHPPVAIFLIDETGNDAYKQAVILSLKEAVKNMPDETCLGIFTFSDSLGYFDLAPEKPALHRFDLDIAAAPSSAAAAAAAAGAAGGCPLLLEAVCLEEAVCPLGRCRDTAIAAIENLNHSFFWASDKELGAAGGGGAAAAATAGEEEAPRAFGAALAAVAALCLGEGAAAAARGAAGGRGGAVFNPAGVRLGLFLAGRPNLGPGAIAPPPPPPPPPGPAAFAAGGGAPGGGGEEGGLPTLSPASGGGGGGAPAGGGGGGAVDAGAGRPPVDRAAEAFYAALAARVTKHALCLHLYAVVPPPGGGGGGNGRAAYVGLRTLLPLATLTGGRASVHELEGGGGAARRRLARAAAAALGPPGAMGCLLRLRCSPSFAPAREDEGGRFGPWCPDAALPDLWHAGGAAPDAAALLVDLRYRAAGGLLADGGGGGGGAGPMLQAAFAYTAVLYVDPATGREPPPEAPAADKGPGGGRRAVAVRRLRVLTVQTEAADAPAPLYAQANIAAVAAAVLHKAIKACQDYGIAEARVLISDWLINCFTALCKHKMVKCTGAGQKPMTSDLTDRANVFSQLIRLVYGILHADFLNSDPAISDDKRAASMSSFINMEPGCIQMALYPSLQAFDETGKRIAKELPLSHQSIISSQGKEFLVDTFWDIMVYHLDQDFGGTSPPPPPAAGASPAAAVAVAEEEAAEGGGATSVGGEEEVNEEGSGVRPGGKLWGRCGRGVRRYLAAREAFRSHCPPEVTATSSGAPGGAFFLGARLLDDRPFPGSQGVRWAQFLGALARQLGEELAASSSSSPGGQ